MQHTFEINTGMLNTDFIESVRAMFGNKKVKIVIEEIEKAPKVNQKDLAKNVFALSERFKGTKVDPNLDLSALGNQMLGE